MEHLPNETEQTICLIMISYRTTSTINICIIGHVNPCGLAVVLCDIIIIYILVLTMYLYYKSLCTLMLNKIHTYIHTHYIMLGLVKLHICGWRYR